MPIARRNGADHKGESTAHHEHVPIVRGPLDNKYILGLILKQRKHLFLAGEQAPQLLCTPVQDIHW